MHSKVKKIKFKNKIMHIKNTFIKIKKYAFIKKKNNAFILKKCIHKFKCIYKISNLKML